MHLKGPRNRPAAGLDAVGLDPVRFSTFCLSGSCLPVDCLSRLYRPLWFLYMFYKVSTEELRLATGDSAPVAHKKQNVVKYTKI